MIRMMSKFRTNFSLGSLVYSCLNIDKEIKELIMCVWFATLLEITMLSTRKMKCICFTWESDQNLPAVDTIKR